MQQLRQSQYGTDAFPGATIPRPRLERVTSALRDRIGDALEMGAIKTGDRLPGTRRLAAELGVDPRLVSSAFRRLEQEGMVQMRARSGVYLAAAAKSPQGEAVLSREWAAEVVAQAVERGVPAHRIGASLGRLTDSQKMRAAVLASTSDQAVGMVRELQDEYGIAAAAVFPEQLIAASLPRSLLRAQLILTTGELERLVRPIAEPLQKPVIVVRVRQDLFSSDWIAFMNGRVYVIVADPKFRAVLRAALKGIPGAANVTILLAGEEAVASIPGDARTYVTESARRMLGREGLPGRVIRPRRVFSSETVRAVSAFLVAHNGSGRTGG